MKFSANNENENLSSKRKKVNFFLFKVHLSQKISAQFFAAIFARLYNGWTLAKIP